MIDMKAKFVSVLIFTVTPDDLPPLAREAALVMQRRIPLLHGFVEGVVMANEEQTECLIVTQWESQDAWSAAQWNENIGGALVDLVESARTFQFRTYRPITVVRS